MSIEKFILVIHARYKIVLLMVMLTVTTTLVVQLLQPKTYKATTSLVLNYKGTDPISGATLPAQLMPGYMATQLDIIKSKSVALRVVDQLELTNRTNPEEESQVDIQGASDLRGRIAEGVRNKIDVAPVRESGVLNISYKAGDPQLAADVANAVAAAYQHVSVQLKDDMLRKASNYFNEQTQALHDKFVDAQKTSSRFQQEKGIFSVDSRLDVETIRLNDLSTQLVSAQNELMEAASRKTGAEGSSGGESPDVIGSPLIQNLKMELARAQSKFAYVAEKWMPSHPQYQAAQEEVNRLRSELRVQTKSTSNSVGNNAKILAKRESDLRAAVEVQRLKVLELNRARDELSVLGKEIDSAQRAYETATQRFIQTNLDGQSNLSDVAVLSAAVPPLRPSNVPLKLSLILALVLGTIFGVGCAFLLEMLDPHLRSSRDLRDVLNAPVLGEMSWSSTKRGILAVSDPLVPRRLLQGFRRS
jgi:chain length determinant protein EpsF